jgi:hypothetical protein
LGDDYVISLIVNERLNDYFVEAINQMHMKIELNIYKEIEFSKEIIRISQKKSEYLVIDYELLLDKGQFVEELRGLRISLSNLNIIVLAKDFKPGSIILKRLVNLGIYNIITKNNNNEIINEFVKILNKNKTYKDVVSFDCEISEKINSQNIYEKKYVHHIGTKIISCIGSESGSGTTHTLVMLANYLSVNKKIAYIEMNETFAIKKFGKITNRLISGKNNFTHHKVDYYWDVNLSKFINERKYKYEYILLDFGCAFDIVNFDFFLMSDIKMCTISGIDWRIENSINAYNYLSEIDANHKWVYLVPFIEKKYLKELNQYIENEIITIPYNVNPFKPEKEVRKKFEVVLHTNNDSIVKKLWRGAKDGIW